MQPSYNPINRPIKHRKMGDRRRYLVSSGAGAAGGWAWPSGSAGS